MATDKSQFQDAISGTSQTNEPKSKNNGSQNSSTGSSARKPNSRPRYRNRNRGHNGSSSTQRSVQEVDTSIGGARPNERGRAVSRFDADKAAPGANSPAFYTRVPGLLGSVTNVYDNYRAGDNLMEYEDTSDIPLHTAFKSGKWRAPSAMLIRVIMNPGVSRSGDASRLTAAAQAWLALYSMIRHYNAGSANYEAGDLACYIDYMCELFAFHAFLVRIYGLLNSFNPLNKYTAESIIRPMTKAGVNYTDLVMNQQQFLYLINSFARALSQFCIPNVWTAWLKWYEAFSYVYLDSQSNRASYYIMVPDGLHVYKKTDTETVLDYKLMESIWDGTASGLAATIDTLLKPLRTNPELGIMSGDILKAYGLGNLVSLPIITEQYVVKPVYNTEMLTMFENMAWFPASNIIATARESFFKIYVDENSLLIFGQGAVTCALGDESLPPSVSRHDFLNFRHDAPTQDEILIATRLRPSWNFFFDEATDNWKAILDTCDTLLPVSIEIANRYYPEDLAGTFMHTVSECSPCLSQYDIFGTSSVSVIRMLQLTALQYFEYTPFIDMWCSADATSPNAIYVSVFGNIDVPVRWSKDQQRQLDGICLLSEFWVPGIAQIPGAKTNSR